MSEHLSPAEQEVLHGLVAAVRCEVEAQDETFYASDYDIARVIEAVRPAFARDALYSARDALYRGDGPDMVADSDIVYGEWLGNRADQIGSDA